jgi:hypothetical protein
MMTRSLLFYRVSIGLLIGAVLLLASRHYTAVRALDALRADQEWDAAYIRSIDNINTHLNRENESLKTTIETLRRDNGNLVVVGDGPLYNLMSRERAIAGGRLVSKDQPPLYYQLLIGKHQLHKPRAVAPPTVVTAAGTVQRR